MRSAPRHKPLRVGYQQHQTEAVKVHRSERWRRFSLWFRKLHPICCNPLDAHKDGQPAEHVHHVVAIAAAPDLAFDEQNCVPLCRSCHSKIEQLDRGGMATGALFRAMRGTQGV